MADYFTNFSFIVSLNNTEQQQQALHLFEQMSAIQRGEEEPENFPAQLRESAEDCVFEVEAQDTNIWIHSDCGGVDGACEFVHHLVKQFQLAPVSFQWSYDCTKPRTDAYGGGAAYITAQEIRSLSTHEWIKRQKP